MTNANSKDAVENKFSGKLDKGLTFEEFDKKALSWARKEYGNSYAKQLWENTLPDINNLDLKEDYDYYLFQEHCEYVYDMLCLESDLVIFEAQNSKALLVVEHLSERINAVVVNLIVVQIKFLQSFVVDHGLAEADQTQVANQIGLQTQTHKAEQ